TATSQTPVPAGSFAIGATSSDTAKNFSDALTSAISTLANTSLVAASAVQAGDNFFNTDSSAMGTSSVNNQAGNAITGATSLMAGPSGSDSLSPGFTAPSTITVNGTTLNLVVTPTGPNDVAIGGSVQSLLSKIDAITGTTTPSTVHGGVVTINTPNAATFSIPPPARLSAPRFTPPR